MRINIGPSWEPGKPGPYLTRLTLAIEAAARAAGEPVDAFVDAMGDTDAGPSRLTARVVDSLIRAGGGPDLRCSVTHAVPEFLLRRRNDEPESREPVKHPDADVRRSA